MSILDKIRATRRDVPVRMVVHGAGGCGKSTFAAASPRPIFMAAEDGLVNIDASALPPPSDWEEAMSQLDMLSKEAHEYKTIAIDSLDWLEPLVWANVCKRGGKKDIEAFGYGKGYIAAQDDWRIFLSKLSLLHYQGMNIVMIAHSVRKAVKNPEGDDYEQWQIKIHEKASGLIREWVDIVGFASHEVVTSDATGRIKGISTGRRLLKVQPNAGYDAKTRYELPKAIPLDWASFAKAMRPEAIDDMWNRLRARCQILGDPILEAKAICFVEQAGKTRDSIAEAIATIDDYIRTNKVGSA